MRGEERLERLAVEPRERRLEFVEAERDIPHVDEQIDERRALHDKQSRGGAHGAVRVEQARHAREVQAVGRPDGREDRAAAGLGGEVVPAAVAGEVDEVVAG